MELIPLTPLDLKGLHGVDTMKEVLVISAIALLFGITGAGAEEQAVGKNLVPVAERNAVYNGRRRRGRTAYYRGSGRYGRGGDRYIGDGPYPLRLTPGGMLTGPIPPSGPSVTIWR